MKRCVFVISGGEIGDPSFVGGQIAAHRPGDIICADRGARHLRAIGRIPSVIIGDMDSLDAALEAYFTEAGSRIITHPERKDETDTQLALEYALDLRPDEVWIFGALGGRIDHSLANISLLALGVERGIEVKLVDEWCEVFVVTRHRELDGEPGQTVSLFPFSGLAEGITLEGFEYPLQDGRMELGRPYGISNRLSSPRARISIASGTLLVIRYFREECFPGEQ